MTYIYFIDGQSQHDLFRHFEFEVPHNIMEHFWVVANDRYELISLVQKVRVLHHDAQLILQEAKSG